MAIMGGVLGVFGDMNVLTLPAEVRLGAVLIAGLCASLLIGYWMPDDSGFDSEPHGPDAIGTDRA